MLRGYAIPSPAIQAGPPAWALSEVRTRRVFALCLDLAIISALYAFWLIALALLGFATFGLSWMLIPILFPAVAVLYNGLSISGRRMATPGMRAFGLEARLADGTRAPALNAAAHVVLLYLSVVLLTPFILLVSFISPEKRCLHDMLAGLVVTRRI